MPAYASVAKGTILLVSGRVGSALLSFCSTAVLARLLLPKEFGVIAAAWVLISLANVLFDGAFGQNLLRKRSARPEDVRTTLTMGLALGVVLMAGVVVTAPCVAGFFDFPQLAEVLAVLSLVIPFKAIFAVATSQLQLKGRFGTMAGTALGAAFIGNFLIGIPLAMLGFGVWALVAAAVVTGFCEATILSFQARIPMRPLLNREAVSDVVSSGFFSLANILNWMANTGASAVVGRTMGDVSLGLYSRGWKLLDLFVAVTATPLSRVLLPTFTRIEGDRARLSGSFVSVLELAIPAYAVASALLTIHAFFIVRVALGPNWDDTIPLAQILFSTLVPRCTVKVSESFAVACGRARSTAVRQGFYAVLMIVGAGIGTRWGVLGVAIAVSIAISIFYLASMCYAMRLGSIGLPVIANLHGKALVLGVAVLAVDAAVLYSLSGHAMAIRHLLAGTVAAITCASIVLTNIDFWIGSGNAEKWRALVAIARDRLSKFQRRREQRYGR